MNEDEKFTAIEKDIEAIKKDLHGSSERAGVFENLRQLHRLVKISIVVSLLGAGAGSIKWESLIKMINLL